MIAWLKRQFKFLSKKKIELFPIVFDSVEGENFREEEYYIFEKQKKKIEFFDLKQNKYFTNFAKMKQYVVWTLKDDVFRVFIIKDFYQKFNVLYQKEINIIYMIFISKMSEKILFFNKQKKILIFVSLFLLIPIFFVFLFRNNFIFVLLILCFFLSFFLFLFFSFKKLLRYKKDLFDETIKRIKLFLGLKNYENLIEEQKLYIYKQDNEIDSLFEIN
ncbi:MAG: hypothetical protein Q8784_00205 [Vigna little leaf phytoplasma]|nr:hypothetical protein [Vigna little leaf phytoplasma]